MWFQSLLCCLKCLLANDSIEQLPCPDPFRGTLAFSLASPFVIGRDTANDGCISVCGRLTERPVTGVEGLPQGSSDE